MGNKKYGTDLDRKDLNTLEWIQHLQDELHDAYLYSEKLKVGYIAETKQLMSEWIKKEKLNGGKIGGGIVMQAAIEAGVPKNKLMMPNEFNSQIQKPSDKTLNDFVKMFKELSGSKKSDKDLLVELKENIARDKTWWMSKYLGVHYVYTIMDQGKQEVR